MTITSDNWRFTHCKMQKTLDFKVASEKEMRLQHGKTRINIRRALSPAMLMLLTLII